MRMDEIVRRSGPVLLVHYIFSALRADLLTFE